MECFSYEGGHGIHIGRHLKEVLALVVVKYFWFNNNVVLLKQLLPGYQISVCGYMILNHHVMHSCGIQLFLSTLITVEYCSSYCIPVKVRKFVFTVNMV